MIISSETPNQLVFSGFHGLAAQQYNVRIDAPDLAPVIGGLGQFTLRQFPIPVPEPSAIMLVGLALVGIGWYRRRS